MLINTNELKQNNAITKQIPNYVWDLVFWSELDDKKVPSSELLKLQELPEDKEQALVLLIICYPNYTASNLLKIARDEFKLTDSSIFTICAAMNRTDCFDLFDKKQQESFIAEDDYTNLNRAAASGASKTLQWFEDKLVSERIITMIKAKEFRAFQSSCEYGQVDSLKWIMRMAETEKNAMLDKISIPVLSRVTHKGHTKVIEWLKEQSPEKIGSMIKNISSNGYARALFENESPSAEMLSLLNLKNNGNNEVISLAQIMSNWGVFKAIGIVDENGTLIPVPNDNNNSYN